LLPVSLGLLFRKKKKTKNFLEHLGDLFIYFFIDI